MTTAQHLQYNYEGSVVHAIKTDLAAISIVDIGAKAVVDQAYFGVNGTFFSGSALTGIAMQNGVAVRTGGNRTGQACNGIATKRGTIFCYGGGSSVTTGVVDYASEANLSNVKWAIGGYSLFPNVAYGSIDKYYADINGNGDATDCSNAVAETQNAFRFAPRSKNERTAIGWDGSKIWLVAFDSADAWTVRKFMIARGCNLAVMLDGGSSTQMKYAVIRNGNPVATNYNPSGGIPRQVFSMVRVSATEWI
ncbi:phosphodiester glycosidase family protein [Paenibacillus wulumuqiensis]|uniref:phosphodiester glycosidase family protein n=1 Tax=Paenibacillus wulumuqiensis TaxID=1567107 RepID=UPI000619436D|nr:phosphodiester glycosidase family protein [Paenibacillus wulumuqiensis]